MLNKYGAERSPISKIIMNQQEIKEFDSKYFDYKIEKKCLLKMLFSFIINYYVE